MEVNDNGEEVMKCGFKIGGGIDQDFRKSPQGYTDNVSGAPTQRGDGGDAAV